MGLEMLLPMLMMGAMGAMGSKQPEMQPIPPAPKPTDPPLPPLAGDAKQPELDALQKYKNSVLTKPQDRMAPPRQSMAGGPPQAAGLAAKTQPMM
jgi:hypothetical protein